MLDPHPCYYAHIAIIVFFCLSDGIVRPEHGFFIRWFRSAHPRSSAVCTTSLWSSRNYDFYYIKDDFSTQTNKKIITISIIIITTVLAIVSETLYINNEYFT